MIWGETGTREGATRRQLASVGFLWSRFPIKELHDGDCVGVDYQLFWLAQAFLIPHIVVHPPKDVRFRAGVGLPDDARYRDTDVHLREPKDYHARDRDVVDGSDVLVACPQHSLDEDGWTAAKGGTWYTINYALSKIKPVAIVWPNGVITYKNWTLGAVE